MDKFFHLLSTYIAHGEALPLRILLFRLLCVSITFVCIFLVIPSNMMQVVSPWLNPVVALYAFIVFCLYGISRRGKHYVKTLYLLTLLLLSISWILNGGSTGSISYFYLTILIIPLVLFSRILRVAMLVLIVVNYSVLVLTEQSFPQLITPFMSSSDRFLDLLTGFAVSVFLIVSIFWVIVTGYDNKLKEHETSEKELLESRNALEANLTSLQNAQQELLQYQILVEGSRDTIFIIDQEFRLGLVNRAFLKFLGMDRGDVAGRPLNELVDATAFRVFKSFAESCFATERHLKFEMKYNSPLRGELMLDITLTRIEGKGVAERVACVARNITKQKMLEEQLRHSQRLDSIGQLAGGIAHDFNNILSVIGGYAYLIEVETESRNADTSYIKEIISASDRASALTRGLLAFSRKQNMEPVRADLNHIVNGVRKFIGRLISEDIAFSVEESAHPLPVFADAGEIQQILINLATNSRDAMPQGGRFHIALNLADIDAAFVEANGFGVPGRYGVMTVSDSGCGMDEATRSKIFDPFFTTKEVGRGTGLGLAIAYGIVKQHQGVIAVDSTPGIGTVVAVYIPLMEESSDRTVPEQCERQPGADKLQGDESILFVEDDEKIRNLMVSVLSSYGYTVIPAVNGETGVELFNANCESISLVISDIIMPKLNGVEMAEQLRKIKPGIKVIFTSGYTKTVLQDKGQIREAGELLMKPLHPLHLLKRIRECLNTRIEGEEEMSVS